MFHSEQIFNALSNVSLLKNNLIHGDVPCMQAANLAVKYEVNFNTNNEDSNGFRVVQAVYKQEAQVHGELHTLLEEGKEFVIMLYTWRSCSRALPTASGNNSEVTNSIQEKTIEILKPYIDKLKKFQRFQNEAVTKFCEEINNLCKRRKREEFLSEANMLAMCNMLKMFVLIDEMKNMKAGMKNDHTQYKRAAQHLKILDSTDATEFSMYLAQQNVLRCDLKKELIKIPGFEDFFVELINLCVSMYIDKFYLYQEEKHTLVLVVAFSLYLMDTYTNPIININRMKKLPLSKIDQIFKECEVVNVFGDMSISPFGFIKATPNYDPNRWPENTNNKISTQGLIMNHILQFRSEYTSLTAELARYSNSNVINQNEESKENNKSAYDLALKSLQLLSKWTTQIIDTFSWKLGHLADSHINVEIPKDAEDYEKATRYNYDSQEKFALIEVIAMIKTIQTQLSRMECHFMETVIPYIYTEMQTFLHITIHEIFNKISKKTQLPFIVQSLWAIGSDPKAVNEAGISVSDKAMTLSKKRGAAELSQFIENMKNQLRPRKIPPGSTQLYLIRCIVESLFQNKTKNKLRKEFDQQSLLAMEEFHKRSFFWSYLLNFSDTLSICCDLSQLWYREFFLEMTNGKRIQFPIETSIPCILTNHILDTQDPAYIEYLLYPLDLYNDSAVCALKKFKRQFLYNEIEAEVNFMMIQLVVRLSDQIFMFYKQFAASMLLNKRFKNQVNNSGKSTIHNPPPERYVTLMKQRHLQLLGRSFNLCKLISYRINKSLYESLEAIIRRFTKNGLTNILEFDSLISVHRLCYENLSKYLELDDFDCVLSEIIQSTTSTFGSISEFIIKEITDIICPNFSYNSGTSRFVPMIETYRVRPAETATHDRIDQLWGSKTLNSCYEIIMKLYNGYLGKEHILVICKYVGYDGIYWLLIRLKELAESLLNGTLKHYVSLLMEQMPSNLSSQFEGKSASEMVKLCNDALRKVIDIPNLTTEVSKALNTFGNCIIFVMQMENNLGVNEALDLKQAYPFINILPQPSFASNPEELEKIKIRINKKYSIYKINNVLDKVGTAEQVELSKQHFDLTKERLCTENSIIKYFLKLLQNTLHQMKVVDEDNVEINFWTKKDEDTNFGVFEYDDSAFYMVWSAILYSFSKTDNKIRTNIDETYGEGLFWAGCTILALLNQQRFFEYYDICGKIMRAHKISNKDKLESDLNLMYKRIRCLLQINSRIFDILNRFLFTIDDYNYIKPTIFHMNPNIITNATSDNVEEFDD